jgi:hypothetical protein
VTNDVDTLATAIYATTDDMLKEHPDLAPWRPPVGITPRLGDAELVALVTMQAIPGYCASHSSFFWGLLSMLPIPSLPSPPATPGQERPRALTRPAGMATPAPKKGTRPLWTAVRPPGTDARQRS